MFSKRSFALIACAGVLGLATVAQAAAPVAPAPTSDDGVELIKHPSARFDRSLEAAALEVRYDVLLEQARNLKVAPEDHLLAERITTEPEIRDGIRTLGVNPAGYYGKYQFDMGTWASVGGSGNPAEASEEEQDYRAAVLYSRAGSSPWPVCGA